MTPTTLFVLTLIVLAAAFACLLGRRRRSTESNIQPSALSGIIKHPSPNFDERRESISVLVLHYTALATDKEGLDKLTDATPGNRVSAHYLVSDQAPTIYSLVDENKRAWHAGVSSWDGMDDINSRSIGIEITNTGEVPFTDVQMKSVVALCKDILSRHNIPAHNVIGHSDVAPGRKPDPGPLFDWKLLFNNGIGVWPVPTKDDYDATKGWGQKEIRKALAQYGWSTDVTFPVAVEAFQRHFQQEKFTPSHNTPGTPDAETSAILHWLNRHKPDAID